MQYLPSEILSQARAEKMKELDSKMKEVIEGHLPGEKIICPFCHYQSNKNPKGSCVVFSDSIKCFSCGIWRKV
jgi:uncharacterized protein YbcI